jgi:hypothetical protein
VDALTSNQLPSLHVVVSTYSSARGCQHILGKYQSLGKFPDVYCGDTAIPFEFHLKSRDLVCGGGGAEADEALRAHYRASMVYEADRVDEGISKGNLIRSDAVATAATEALEMALRNSEALAEELANQ